jgi:hypothetical protein
MSDGRIPQSYAILRHWSRQLGAYDGKTEDEKTGLIPSAVLSLTVGVQNNCWKISANQKYTANTLHCGILL